MDTQQHALTSLTAPQTPAPVWYWCCSTTLPPGWSSSAMLTHTGTPMASAACTKLASQLTGQQERAGRCWDQTPGQAAQADCPTCSPE